ncbi:DoxX family membrane protein [Pseudanabaena sp. FACHB-2040]|uniref:DoxX family protein n=1 Tax=Pseudanabaena sp. FACHB-2040 TaxID=2692859 RepID=UPI00168357E7|nr:DoxX family membrane protein [Pseudanabaena sp. FACHB-2040]MBD0266981.1 DoxX family membrane protein [Cyanobacteria bacterium Co-bin8]MBD2259176.1 DoxX family membrane protein [Pseudanabaena sp. FACHB-2040]
MSSIASLIASKKEPLRIALAVSMVAAGLLHFVIPAQFIKIVPGFLPFPAALVYGSGVIEILLGIGLLIPPVQRLAAIGLVVLFIAVYPANINMAVNQIHITGLPDQNWLFHALRLPFQFVLIAWAYWYTRPDRFSQTSTVPEQEA